MANDKRLYECRKSSKFSNNRAAKCRISKRKPPAMEKDAGNVSTSAKKLRLSEGKYEASTDASFGYRFIEFTSVFFAISQLVVCKVCGSDVSFRESSSRGLGFKIVLFCKRCKEQSINSCPLINNHAYDVNRRIILAMRLLGVGFHGITKFCAVMDLPRPIFHSLYDTVVSTIAIATGAVKDKSMKNAAEEEKRIACEWGEINGLTVSGDGSWRKRGFSSLCGLVTLIGWSTGKVLDVIGKSKYCKACEYWKKKEGTAEYEEWAENHAHECQNNYQGSSGKMEAAAAVEIFRRSEKLYGVKYAQYIGDGDSKTFKAIADAKPYEDFNVLKKECVDHVQKRMGTRLRNLVKGAKGLGGKGGLTGKLIDELSTYYGLAVRRNADSIDDMRNEIWATLHHKISTDKNPQHDNCPAGENSWCTWQKAKACNQLGDYKHKPAMPDKVFKAITPDYDYMTRDDLLIRCIGGYTQNSNESFNAVVWSIAPKTSSSGKIIVDIATDIAVCTFNDGFQSVMQIMQLLEMKIGVNCYQFCLETDANRIKVAESRMTDAAKEARRDLRSIRKAQDEENFNIEGQLYGAGIAE